MIVCVGPIQKLTVPDFQQISNFYEQMQNEILEKPSQARYVKLTLGPQTLTSFNNKKGYTG